MIMAGFNKYGWCDGVCLGGGQLGEIKSSPNNRSLHYNRHEILITWSNEFQTIQDILKINWVMSFKSKHWNILNNMYS